MGLFICRREYKHLFSLLREGPKCVCTQWHYTNLKLKKNQANLFYENKPTGKLSSRFSEQSLSISQIFIDRFIGSSEEAKYLSTYKPALNIWSFPADLTAAKWPPMFGRILQPFDDYTSHVLYRFLPISLLEKFRTYYKDSLTDGSKSSFSSIN